MHVLRHIKKIQKTCERCSKKLDRPWVQDSTCMPNPNPRQVHPHPKNPGTCTACFRRLASLQTSITQRACSTCPEVRAERRTQALLCMKNPLFIFFSKKSPISYFYFVRVCLAFFFFASPHPFFFLFLVNPPPAVRGPKCGPPACEK